VPAERTRTRTRICAARRAIGTYAALLAQALARALEQASVAAGARLLDAGDLLVALLEQPDRLIAAALAQADVDLGALREAIEAARQRGE
jgi:ATP-dependent Clp protease ATP-binding subunit ClpA